MDEIGYLQRVPLRQVWGSEPNDFSPWLEKNIEVLNESIGLSISIAEREHKPTDRLSLDLLGEAETGFVVIENQLGTSDHDHLGKLITYLTAIDAKVGIWIVADPKPEHIGAISWLNQTNLADFYLVKLEAVRVEESLPAPLLTLIVGPSVESKQVGENKKEEKERDTLRLQFWTQLLDRAREKTLLHANLAPVKWGSIWVTVKKGLFLQYTIRQHNASVSLYIDVGIGKAGPRGNENQKIFDALEEAKGEIEEVFGEPLEWKAPLEVSRGQISKDLSQGGYRNETEDWARIQDVMIDAMIRLNNALEPHIKAF